MLLTPLISLLFSSVSPAVVAEGGCALDLSPLEPRVPQTSWGPDFDSLMFGRCLNGWWCKGGQAAEYRVCGSNFRSKRPQVSRTASGGLFVVLEMDHTRRLTRDDHAQVCLEFNAFGRLVAAQATIKIQGRPCVRSGRVVATDAPGAANPARWVASTVANQLRCAVASDRGGRRAFPDVIQHNMELVGQCVVMR